MATDRTEPAPEFGPDAGTKALLSEDGRGNSTEALRAFAQGDVIFKEPPLALIYSMDDVPWLKAMREDLVKLNEACGWQYCVAVHCLTAEELPRPLPEGLVGMEAGARRQMEDLCGVDFPAELEPSDLAGAAARHLIAASRSASGSMPATELLTLRRCLDSLAARVSRNGFQIMDLNRRPPTSADGLFHRISFFNHCCAGLNNASWTWDGKVGLLTVKASRAIAVGEELCISYIGKPWSELGKAARQKYLEQNFNFTVCVRRALCLPKKTRS
jgi:hypothetical protein